MQYYTICLCVMYHVGIIDTYGIVFAVAHDTVYHLHTLMKLRG
jgi:hypothetical protein